MPVRPAFAQFSTVGSAERRIDLVEVNEAMLALAPSGDPRLVFGQSAELLVPVVCDRAEFEVLPTEGDACAAAEPGAWPTGWAWLAVRVPSSPVKPVGVVHGAPPAVGGWLKDRAPWMAVLTCGWEPGYQPGPPDAALIRLLGRCAVAAVDQGVRADHLAQAAAKISNLNIALSSNRTIGAAVGVLMSRRRLTYQAAFELLSDRSHRLHRKIVDLADEVLYAGDLA